MGAKIEDKRRLQNKQILFYFFGFLYIVFLQILYEAYIYPLYHTYGFKSDFSILRCILAYLISVFFLYIIQRYFRDLSISKTVISFFIIANAIPCLVLYIYMPADFILLLLIFYCCLLLSYAFIPVFQFKGTKRSHNIKINLDLVITIIFIIFAIFTVFIWAVYANFNLQFSLLDVYETRQAARVNMPDFFTTINNMAGNIIPIIAIYYLMGKKYWGFILSAVIQFLSFSITASKSTFFCFIFAIGIYFLVKYGKDVVQYGIYTMVIGAVASIIFNLQTIVNIFYRRILFIPALLNYWYYEFFNTNGLDFYAHSIVGKIFGFQSKYSLSLPFEIGRAYSTAETSANNGLFSDAYANLGVLGCIIMPICLVIVLKFADGATTKIPKQIWAAVAIEFFLTFNSSSFFTALLTHGILLIIILFYVINSQEDKCKELAAKNSPEKLTNHHINIHLKKV